MKMKLCKDCKWQAGIYCKSPHNMTVDLVTGEAKARDFEYCINHRNPPLVGWLDCRIAKLCGAEGRWFEAKTQIHGETKYRMT